MLSVRQTDLAQVVNLGLNVGVLVQLVLGGERKSGLVVNRGPAERDAQLQLVVDTLVDRSTDLGSIVHVRVQGEVSGLVADGEVVASQLRLGRVERGLET